MYNDLEQIAPLLHLHAEISLKVTLRFCLCNYTKGQGGDSCSQWSLIDLLSKEVLAGNHRRPQNKNSCCNDLKAQHHDGECFQFIDKNKAQL